jgi:hypothetical protein
VEIVVAKLATQPELNTLRLSAPTCRETVPPPRLVLKQVCQRYTRDSVADAAGALSYYFVFALFPFLFLLTTLTAYVPYLRGSSSSRRARCSEPWPGSWHLGLRRVRGPHRDLQRHVRRDRRRRRADGLVLPDRVHLRVGGDINVIFEGRPGKTLHRAWGLPDRTDTAREL